MSLSSFLLGKRHSKADNDIDGDLDTLIRSSISTLPKHSDQTATNAGAKRRKDTLKDDFPAPSKRKKSVDARGQSSRRPPPTTNPESHSKAAKEKKGAKNKEPPAESDDEEDDAGLEEAYERKVRPEKQIATGSSKNKARPSGSSDSEGETSQLIHETAVVKKDRRSKTRQGRGHNVPPDETREQRDARTIFLGNVPTQVAKEKSALKDLKRHILSHVPGVKIESMRFRSVAFQRPTSAAPAPRTHSVERTAEWRAGKGDDVPVPRPRLGPGDKRRIAFIKHELHPDTDAVTVYVVFAYGADLAPDEAAQRAVAVLDNTQYMGRTLRADAVAGGVGDPKRTVFVGGLDFASGEEDLRIFFEGVVSGERGPRSAVAGDSDSSDEEDARANLKTWVTRVRIVRDKDTRLGKGFAYVQFADRECVDEILALEPGKLKFAKRKLRVERCKTLPSSSNASRDPRTSTSSPPRTARPPTKPTPTTIPKGNPGLGTQLAHLSKDERKVAKAADAERVARRLAKKKARNVLQVPEQKKDRVRVRKHTTEHKGAGTAARQKKSRVRSERNAARQNTKK